MLLYKKLNKGRKMKNLNNTNLISLNPVNKPDTLLCAQDKLDQATMCGQYLIWGNT